MIKKKKWINLLKKLDPLLKKEMFSKIPEFMFEYVSKIDKRT